ncbi:MAG: response regulator transcription factor, partial [Cyanobacteria bacterium]|nr:response regulator transcription factor [Cyanobacteriota bacterium]
SQVRALLRRPTLSAKLLLSGDVSMNTEAGTVTRNDELIHLHPMEFKLLQFLLKHPNQIFSTHAIFERVWQKDFGQLEDTVRTHVRTLRQKIDLAGDHSIITTVRGLGYKSEYR